MAEERERTHRAPAEATDEERLDQEGESFSKAPASFKIEVEELPTGDESIFEDGDDGEGDWEFQSEADLAFWFEDGGEEYEDASEYADDLEWEFEDEEMNLLIGGASVTERRLSEASRVIALSEFGLAEGSIHVTGHQQDKPDGITELLARVVPTSPLLGLLDSEWLRSLLEMGDVVKVAKGDAVFKEGDEGDSLFLLLSGGMQVEMFNQERDEDVHVATLRPGEFFGEAALLSDAIRSGTLRAVSDSIGLEFESDAILTLVEHQPSVIKLLMRFFRARMVGAVMHCSPLFHKCSARDRRDLITRFRMREVAPDAYVVRAGETVDSLYLVVDGQLSVCSGDDQELWTLKKGDVFGERSLIDGMPATTSLKADHRSWILRMPRGEFLDAICKHPHLMEHVNAAIEPGAVANDEALNEPDKV